MLPALTSQSKAVTILQRTPSWVLPKPSDEFGSISSLLLRLPYSHIFLRRFLYRGADLVLPQAARPISARHLVEHIALRHLRRQVVDINLRDLLTADYPIGSKRILFDSKFYPALSHHNDRLVTNPIRRITSDAVQTANEEQMQADIVICVTGFKASEFLVPISVRTIGALTTTSKKEQRLSWVLLLVDTRTCS
ncbi:hypothetical protein SCAR479_06792 [Seiridium cardinale]|uniref:Flavin-containing monooxygenase n=1 Tax=Seiridium cardinale TaxID=138064 RepID=A0ABR2XS11_9PEZI